jgi:hypothetical protein
MVGPPATFSDSKLRRVPSGLSAARLGLNRSRDGRDNAAMEHTRARRRYAQGEAMHHAIAASQRAAAYDPVGLRSACLTQRPVWSVSCPIRRIRASKARLIRAHLYGSGWRRLRDRYSACEPPPSAIAI